jgi:hypothetical protein
MLAGGSQESDSGVEVTTARHFVPKSADTRSSVGVQADGGSLRSPQAVRHVAVDTRGLNPLVAILEVVFRFWRLQGWSFADFLFKGADPTSYPFEGFLQQPLVVKCALAEWLKDYGFDTQSAALVAPWLALWFRDPDDRAPEEEARFFEQMCVVACFVAVGTGTSSR